MDVQAKLRTGEWQREYIHPQDRNLINDKFLISYDALIIEFSQRIETFGPRAKLKCPRQDPTRTKKRDNKGSIIGRAHACSAARKNKAACGMPLPGLITALHNLTRKKNIEDVSKGRKGADNG